MDERSLSSKVFTIIEISSKKWWKQKLGTEYSMLYQKLSMADILNLISQYHIIHAIEVRAIPLVGVTSTCTLNKKRQGG